MSSIAEQRKQQLQVSLGDQQSMILAKYLPKALPAELEMSRDLPTVTLHPKRQVTYQKRHQLVLQELPQSDRARQSQVLNKLHKSEPVIKNDAVATIAVEVLRLNQKRLLDIKAETDNIKKAAFCQSINFCPPNSCAGCFNLYLGGLELAGIPWMCICYYKVCYPNANWSRTFKYATIDEVPLPHLYLVDVSVLKNYDGASMPSFETLKERDMLGVYNFDRCPAFTFVSHKWSGNSPDDAGNSLFNSIKSSLSGYVWVDYMCVPQAGSFDVRLPYLQSIPYVIVASSNVWTPQRTNEYRRSVWCNTEQFLEQDEGLALVEEFRIQNADDLAPIILGLKETLLLLLIHSPDYQKFAGRFVMEPGEGANLCSPVVAGSAQYLIFERPEMHMYNPTLARICEYYLTSKYLT